MGNRRRGREAALQILYQIDLSDSDPREAIALFWREAPVSEEIQNFSKVLVEGVLKFKKEIDEKIEGHSIHWKLGRMACVDRNVLRIAIYELFYCHDIPKSVTLNEAIDLGKKFGTEESGAFVNGILDNIAKNVSDSAE